LAWAKENGGDLRTFMTQRFASSMVFMSFLLGTELNVLFNTCEISIHMRESLLHHSHDKLDFWIGIIIIISVFLTLLTLMTIFTAWGMVGSVSDANAHAILRSSIGMYAAELPSLLIVMALYSFVIWVGMFLFVLLPHIWSIVLLVLVALLFFHIVTVFSALGRVIMHTGAMGSLPIFDSDFEQNLLPRGLHKNLLTKATAELAMGTSVTRQYRRKHEPRFNFSKEISVRNLSANEPDEFERSLSNRSLDGVRRSQSDGVIKGYGSFSMMNDDNFQTQDFESVEKTEDSLSQAQFRDAVLNTQPSDQLTGESVRKISTSSSEGSVTKPKRLRNRNVSFDKNSDMHNSPVGKVKSPRSTQPLSSILRKIPEVRERNNSNDTDIVTNVTEKESTLMTAEAADGNDVRLELNFVDTRELGMRSVSSTSWSISDDESGSCDASKFTTVTDSELQHLLGGALINIETDDNSIGEISRSSQNFISSLLDEDSSRSLDSIDKEGDHPINQKYPLPHIDKSMDDYNAFLIDSIQTRKQMTTEICDSDKGFQNSNGANSAAPVELDDVV